MITSFFGTIMPENSKTQAPVTRFGILTGLITGGSVGWILYRMLKSDQLDYYEIIKHPAFFVGTMGICLTTSAVIFEHRNLSESHKKSTSVKEESSMICGNSTLGTLLDRVDEWDRILADDAYNGNASDKKFSKNIFEPNEVNLKYDDLTKRLNDLNRQLKGNESQNIPADNLMKICCNNESGSSKTKFREDIISLVNELKGYVQGTIDPLPLARKIKFRSNEMNEEVRQQIVMMVREYANNMLQNLEKIINEFVSSGSEPGKVLNDKELKLQNAFKTLGVLEKDLSTAPLKIEMDQYYNALEKATKSKSRRPSGQNNQRSSDVSLVSANPPEQKIINRTKPPSPPMTKLETSTGINMPFKSQVTNPDQPAVEKIKNSHSKPSSKLVLTEEQRVFLNILKSELKGIVAI